MAPVVKSPAGDSATVGKVYTKVADEGRAFGHGRERRLLYRVSTVPAAMREFTALTSVCRTRAATRVKENGKKQSKALLDANVCAKQTL